MRRQRTRKSRIHKGTYVSIMRGITDPIHEQGHVGKVISTKYCPHTKERLIKVRFNDGKTGEYDEDTIRPEKSDARRWLDIANPKPFVKEPGFTWPGKYKGKKGDWARKQKTRLEQEEPEIFPTPPEKYLSKVEKKEIKEDKKDWLYERAKQRMKENYRGMQTNPRIGGWEKIKAESNTDEILEQIPAKELSMALTALNEQRRGHLDSDYENYQFLKEKLSKMDEKGIKRFKDYMGIKED